MNTKHYVKQAIYVSLSILCVHFTLPNLLFASDFFSALLSKNIKTISPALPLPWQKIETPPSSTTTSVAPGGDAMVWTRTATTGETKSVDFSINIKGLPVDCGNGSGEQIFTSSPFQCTYATGGSYQVSITNPDILTKEFSLSDKGITAFWAGKASNFDRLELNDNQITSLATGAFSGASNLNTLDLNNNQLTSLPVGIFDGVPDIFRVNLSDNQLTSLPIGLFSGRSHIDHLNLSNNQLTSLSVGVFDGLSSLYNLFLEGNQLTSLPMGIFSGLSNLVGIHLDGNQLTSLPVGIFSGLISISQLYLGNNQFTSFPVGIFDGIPHIYILDLSNNKLTSLPTGVFSGLFELGLLNLMNNQLTSLPVGVFDGLSNLGDLYLEGNQLTSLPVGVFSGLSDLYRLYLHNNQLTSLPNGVFDGLSNLGDLYLHNNQLTTLPIGVFSGLSNLTNLNLQGNQLTSLPVNTFDGLYEYDLSLNDNCLDTTLSFDNTDANDQWNNQKSSQKVCPTLTYTPSTPTTGNVKGTVIFSGGDATNRTTLETSNPPITYERTENGSKVFDLSTLNNVDLLHPNAHFITGTVDWISPKPPEPPTPPTPPSGGWGGGGGTVLDPDFCPNGDFSPSYYDEECGDDPLYRPDDDTIRYEETANADILHLPAVLEQRVKEFWLASPSAFEDFTLNSPITRAEMAKLIIIFIHHFDDKLAQHEGTLNDSLQMLTATQNDDCVDFADLKTAPLDLQPFIVQACQLGLMGLQADGETEKKNFNPMATVNLAEVATIISRLLRWNTYEGTEQRRYQNHLLALQKVGIIPENVNPMRKEPLGNIFTMLYTLTFFL